MSITTNQPAAAVSDSVRTATDQDRLPAGQRPLLPRLGGGALIAAPLLIAGGALTSPPQDSGSNADYIASLARDHQLTAISATLFHYGWVAIALGILAVMTLVPGRRGRTLTAVGAVGASFGAVQMTGLLLGDWFNGYMGSELALSDAARVMDRVDSDVWLVSWLLSAQVLGLLFISVTFAGLARAGVVGWWTVPVVLLPFFAMPIVGAFLGTVVGAAAGLLVWSPMFLVGLRLIRRPATPVVGSLLSQPRV